MNKQEIEKVVNDLPDKVKEALAPFFNDGERQLVFKMNDDLTNDQLEQAAKQIRQGMAEGYRAIVLPPNVDFAPYDNKLINERLDDIEASIQELIELVDSRTR